MGKELNEHYLKKELYQLIKTDSTLFNFIQEGSLDGMWYWNLENIEDEWLSPKFWEILGYDPKDKKHNSSEWKDIIFKEDLKKATDNLNKHLQDPKYPYDQIVRYKHKDGSTVWIRCRGIAIRDASGRAIRMLGAHTDITDLKHKEASLVESEQRFRVTVQSLDDGVVIHALDGSIIDFNKRALEILGLSRNQLIGKTPIDPIWKFVDEDEKPLLQEKYPINLILAHHKPINYLRIGVVQSTNKEIRWVQVKGTPIFDLQGNINEVVISFFDISQLKNTNKRLLESEQRFKILHNASFGGIAVHDKGIILDCNQGLSDISGFSMDELLRMDGMLLIAPDYRDFVMNKIVTNYEKPYEVFGIRKNKEIYPLKLEARNLPYQGKQVRVVEFRDITELKQKENRLIESEKKFRNLFENAPFGYQSLDYTGHFLEVNQKWLEIMGYQKKEVIGEWFGDFLVPEMKEQFKNRFEIFKKNGNIHSEFPMKTKEGNIILVGFDGNVSYDNNHAFMQTHCTVTDITEINIANHKLKQRNALIEGMFNHMTSGVAIYEVINDGLRGSDYIIKDFNDTSLRWENKSRDEVVGKAISELHPNIDNSGIIEVFRKVWKTGEAINNSARHFLNGNYNRWHDNRIFKLPSGEIVAMYDDVTERVLIENQRAKERLDLLTSQKIAKLGTWRLDVKTNEVTWSEELYKMYGFDPTKPVPPYTEHKKLFTKQSWDILSNALVLTRTKGIPYELELEMALEDESRGWMWAKGEAEYDDQGNIVSLTGSAQDITDKKQKELDIIHTSNHDFLTGLPNRKYYEERLIELDKKMHYPLLIAMIDFDGLKLINDAYGHDIGDEALKKISKILKESIRDNDFVARIGGDEFIILCPNTTPNKFNHIKNTILEKLNFIGVEELKFSLSIGYDVKHDASMAISEILKNAENNMYSNKILHGQSARNETIMTLFETLKEKYDEERLHSDRVSQYCKKMGEKLKLTKDQIKELEFAGLMHDIGKITIPDNILDKPGKLTDEEWVTMKKHTINGYNILRSADKYSRLAEYALTHHERWDGTGYPNGLKGKNIPLFSRIISISDAYEAMTADRAYRKALDKKIAVAELYRCAGSQFDEALVEKFVKEVLQEELKD